MFFELFESSTQLDVISDYRQNKRADSNSDHAADSMMMMEPEKSHVEFYAEIVGKLIGSVRSGIRTFIEDVKNGKRNKKSMEDEIKIMSVTEANMDKSEIFQPTEYSSESSTPKINIIQVLF